MLSADEPADYVIATGETHTVRELVDLAFSAAELEWERYVSVDESFKRGTGEVADLVGDSSAARDRLGWAPTLGFDELVRLMVKADLEQMS
jgi:GDPmannose 4,6-dehydratase